MRRRDLPRARRAQPGLVEAHRAGLVEQASAQARAHCPASVKPVSLGSAGSARHYVLARDAALVASAAIGYPSTRAAREAAQAPLASDYVGRYQDALGDQARRRGLDVQDCLVAVVPAGPGAPASVTAVVTTWLDVAGPASIGVEPLCSTEVSLYGAEVCATITVTGLGVLDHGPVLTRLVRRLARRLPQNGGPAAAVAPLDWVFWPHEG